MSIFVNGKVREIGLHRCRAGKRIEDRDVCLHEKQREGISVIRANCCDFVGDLREDTDFVVLYEVLQKYYKNTTIYEKTIDFFLSVLYSRYGCFQVLENQNTHLLINGREVLDEIRKNKPAVRRHVNYGVVEIPFRCAVESDAGEQYYGGGGQNPQR